MGFEGNSRSICRACIGVGLLLIWSQCSGTEGDWLWTVGLLGATLLPLGMVSACRKLGFKHWGSDKRWDALRLGWLSVALLVCLF